MPRPLLSYLTIPVISCVLLTIPPWLAGSVRADESAEPTTASASTDKRNHLTYCVDPDWMPFERINKAGNHEGIVADFMQAFAERLPVPIQLVPTSSWAETLTRARARECDLIPALNASPERREFLNFTAPYVESAVVIIARNDSGYLDGFKALEGSTLGIVSGYIYDELLERDYPEIQRVYAPSVRDAFRLVASGKVDATVASLLTATRLIQEQGLSNLKIAGGTSFSHELRIGVRNDDPQLTTMLQAIVEDLPASTANQILQRWYTVKLQQAPDYTLLYQVSGLALVIILLLYYRSHRISLTRNQLGQLNNRLSDRNARLERLSQRDALTGARNRLKLCSDLQQQLGRCADSHRHLSLILIDLQRLREINLEHGHTIGDLVISEACQVVRDNLSAGSVMGRWAGSQFLVLLPDTDTGHAITLQDSISRQLAQYGFSDNIQLTVRAACTSYKHGESQATLLNRLECGLKEQHPSSA